MVVIVVLVDCFWILRPVVVVAVVVVVVVFVVSDCRKATISKSGGPDVRRTMLEQSQRKHHVTI